MFASAIRELATSNNPQWVAAAFFERTIQIWDLKSQEKINEFQTVFCTGANNLALAPLGGILVAGLSRNSGRVAAYKLPSGKKIWEQRLIYPSSLRFHPSGQSILCIRNERSILRIDAHSGDILEVIDGTSRYIEDASENFLRIPIEKGNIQIGLPGKGHAFNVDARGLWLLDAKFSPHSVCLSQARGTVRCISYIEGKLLWEFDPGSSSHVLRLHYSPTQNAFFGVLRNFEKGGPRHLMRFDAARGLPELVCEFDSWEEVFLDTADQLVTSAGEIRDLSNGNVVGRLAFPQREYHPDS